ncbi:MAG: FAD-dependent oxidoreductase [Anaerolineae bacterium]|nr:FAD-dependent oxidoreductase [Anaerolineae bacterium]
MADTIQEPARDIPVVADADVLIAGGGPAGIAAALSAARAGARTVLVERYGYLGGMITGAYVVAILGAGDGTVPVVRGITTEIRERMERLGAVRPRNDPGDYDVDAEIFKWQAVEMLQEAGVRIRLHTWACAPIVATDARVGGAFAESKSGREAFRARVTIDVTADADLAYRAGCACDNETHDTTLGLVIEGVDQARVDDFRRRSPAEYEAIVVEAMEMNGGRLPGRVRLLAGVDATNAESLTQAEIRLRREGFQALMHLRRHLPGYEEARVSLTWPQLGVRLSRRIHGLYRLTDDDLKASRQFPDGIARLGVYFPDWGPSYLIKGLRYDVPYRCLVPESIDGLLVAGRCLSADPIAGNTMRLLVPCLATGQAAGVAAAIAAREGCAPRDVPVEALREALRAQDVYLG